MDWLKPLNPRGEASAGDNNDTQVAWLRVMEGQASPGQIVVSRKVFATHLADISLSLAGYHAITYNLPDGSRLRIVSNSGIHHATLWPSAAVPIPKLPHGFAVVTNWAAPRIFKRVVTIDPPSVEWKTDPIPVPQCATDLEGDNQVFRATSATAYFNHPMVLTDGASRSLWDYLKHRAPALASPNPVVPICVQAGADYSTKVMHYGVDNVIYNKAGASIYTMTLAPAIITLDPEDPQFLPAATDASGTRVALHHTRQAVVAPSFDITFFRTCNEILERLNEAEYSLVERNVVTTVIPLSAAAGGTTLLVDGIAMADGTLEPTGPVHLSLMYARVTGTGSQQWFQPGPPPIGGSGAFVYVAWGFVDADYDLEVGESNEGDTEIRTPGSADPEILHKLVALPKEVGFMWPEITVSLNYPPGIFWRGGRNQADILFPESVSPNYGTYTYKKVRVDTEYEMSATPNVEIDFLWSTLRVFDGAVVADMTGGWHTNERDRGRGISLIADLSAYTYILEEYPGGFSVFATPEDMAAWYAYAEGANLLPALIAKLEDFPYPRATDSEVIKNTSPVNTGSYQFKSRHVIDYDHKGRFYAALRVEVECSGAEWQSGPTYWGDMELTEQATYIVRIYFETNWKGAIAETLLTESGATRDPFEFAAVAKSNVMHTAIGIGPYPGDIIVHTPPNLSPPMECYEQLKTMVKHQGTNPHLVCADVRDDITGPAAAKVQSTAGIEFSTIEGGAIRPHTKYVTGQLYARTFKLADFPDALWLLHSTKCDATENDAGTGPTYFYMPTLKTTIDTVDFHVEVRDGVHETWSDEIAPGPGQPADPVDRNIKLYRV